MTTLLCAWLIRCANDRQYYPGGFTATTMSFFCHRLAMLGPRREEPHVFTNIWHPRSAHAVDAFRLRVLVRYERPRSRGSPGARRTGQGPLGATEVSPALSRRQPQRRQPDRAQPALSSLPRRLAAERRRVR